MLKVFIYWHKIIVLLNKFIALYFVYCLNHSMLTGKDDTSPAANHILGLAYVPDNYNGLILRVTWERDSYVKSLRSILGLIEAQGKISSSSRVYLISPYRLVGLYLAKVQTVIWLNHDMSVVINWTIIFRNVSQIHFHKWTDNLTVSSWKRRVYIDRYILVRN